MADTIYKLYFKLFLIFVLKIVDDLRETGLKPPLVNGQNAVYKFQCDLCDVAELCRIHVPSPSSTRRGTLTFGSWQAFHRETRCEAGKPW